MKYQLICDSGSNPRVAPLVGAWIEIMYNAVIYDGVDVAPLVGAWIEIMYNAVIYDGVDVAPLVGAWIEIYIRYCCIKCSMSLLL